jgi:dienelactone hydrolase
LTLPPPTGRYQVGVVNLHLVDHSRAEPWISGQPYRELMVSVLYPARDAGEYPVAHQMTPGVAKGFDELSGPDNYSVPPHTVNWAATATYEHEGAPAVQGRHPVVLYSPGVGDVRSWDSSLVDQLASDGYTVVTIDPTYEASAVQFPHHWVVYSNLLTWYEKAQQTGTMPEFLQKLVDTRVADTRFVLDQLDALAVGHNPDAEQRRLPAGLAQALDVKRIGMFGQSAGGFTALAAMYEDPRIDAAVDMDGTLEYTQVPDGTHLSPVAQHGLAKPFLLLGSDGADGSNLKNEPSWADLWRHSTGWKADVTLPGTRHGSYTDAEALVPQLAGTLPPDAVTADIGTADPERTIAEERGLISGFFRRWL